MPKYLPAKRQWKQVVDGYKLKDNGLAKLIDDFRDLREDEYDKRLAMLSQISKLADATRKSKEVIAAGSKVVKMLDDAIEAAAEIRKRVEADQREAQKVGLHAIDVQIMVVGRGRMGRRGRATEFQGLQEGLAGLAPRRAMPGPTDLSFGPKAYFASAISFLMLSISLAFRAMRSSIPLNSVLSLASCFSTVSSTCDCFS